MSSRSKHLLRNGRLPDGRLVDIEVSDGRISAVAQSGTIAAPDAEDLDGWLILPALAEPHAHLDDVLIAEFAPNLRGDLQGAFDAGDAAIAAGRITRQGMVAKAIDAIEMLIVHGVTAVRSHVAVGGHFGLDHAIAMQEARSHFEGLVDIELVAITLPPMTGVAGASNRSTLVDAIDLGIDLVGGCPHLDPDGPGLIKNALAVAGNAEIGIDLHVDETLDPSMLTLRELAHQVRASGFEHRVVASHCVSLGMQSAQVQAEIAREVAAAGIAIIALPHTNLFLQGRDHPIATPRGLTALAALRREGVVVAAGGDNVQDPFNPVGRSDPLETAALLVMAGHQVPNDAYQMVSNEARDCMGLPRVDITAGDPADLLVVDAASTRQAIADAPMSRRVYRGGALIGWTDQQSVVHRTAGIVKHTD